MNTILSKTFYSCNVAEIVIKAPQIARSRRAGHFVIVRADEFSERIPLTIADADVVNGTITLVVQRIGVSSAKLLSLEVGDKVYNLVGPLGKATDIRLFGTVLCACGGVGAAPMLPIAQALKQAGNRVITILAARSADLIILHDKFKAISDEVIIMTDDGSLGKKGLVTAGIEDIVANEKIDKCITIGPAIMMKFVALTTKKYNIPTDASLNTIMVDGTGMCGACRVTVDGKIRFVCVDGPEFDAHLVDFDEVLTRLRSYNAEERAAYEAYQNLTNTQPMHSMEEKKHTINEDSSVGCQPTTPDWRKELRASMKAKERVAIPRVKMNELLPQERVQSMHLEVNQGLSKEQAILESKRCLDCANPTCVQGCPVNIQIPDFIKRIEVGDIAGAAAVIKQSSTLPAVCGRVCPQEKQCEAHCIHTKMGNEPVAIGYLERYAADHAPKITSLPNETAILGKIAVVGSGPAGLSFAGDMAKLGYQVTVFEALHEIGGVLKYGIPEFRLPNYIVDEEIDSLKRLGVAFCCDTIIGKTYTIQDLQDQGFVGIFVGSGAGLPRFMNIPGENLNGVLSCNEYLTRVNLMGAAENTTDTPLLSAKNVIVIGGGNTAMDAVRTAKRLGAKHATIVYRRSEEEMPARIEEIRHAKEEGIEFMTLHNPIAYQADAQGRVCEAIMQVMQLGEPDESGRRSPIPVEGETKTIPADLVVVSVGVSPNPLIPSTIEGLDVSRKGTIVVDENMQSSIPIIFAGGDIVRGGATVILAMADGRKAAQSMHSYLSRH